MISVPTPRPIPVWYGCRDLVAATKGRAIEHLSSHARLGVAVFDSRFWDSVVGDDVGDAVIVDVGDVGTEFVIWCGPSEGEAKAREVDLADVEVGGAQDCHDEQAIGVERDFVCQATGVDVNRDGGADRILEFGAGK